MIEGHGSGFQETTQIFIFTVIIPSRDIPVENRRGKEKCLHTLFCYGYFDVLKGRLGRSDRNVIKTVHIQWLLSSVVLCVDDNRGGSGHGLLDLSYDTRVDWEALWWVMV